MAVGDRYAIDDIDFVEVEYDVWVMSGGELVDLCLSGPGVRRYFLKVPPVKQGFWLVEHDGQKRLAWVYNDKSGYVLDLGATHFGLTNTYRGTFENLEGVTLVRFLDPEEM